MEIPVEPFGALLAANPSSCCSATFLPPDAPLVAWHLYGIQSPETPAYPTPPGYSIRYWSPCFILYRLIRGVRCLPACSVPNSALGALLVWRATRGHRTDGGRRLARQTLASANKHTACLVQRRAAMKMQRAQHGSQWQRSRRAARRAPDNAVCA